MSEPAIASIDRVQVGQELPRRVFETDTIQQFLYNAVLWNAHKIHFDHPYATGVEGYSGLVVAGPLLGDWLNQCVVDWLGEQGRLLSIEYSNRRAAYVGDTVRSTARVVAVEREKHEVVIDVAIINERDEVLVPGTAVVLLHA